MPLTLYDFQFIWLSQSFNFIWLFPTNSHDFAHTHTFIWMTKLNILQEPISTTHTTHHPHSHCTPTCSYGRSYGWCSPGHSRFGYRTNNIIPTIQLRTIEKNWEKLTLLPILQKCIPCIFRHNREKSRKIEKNWEKLTLLPILQKCIPCIFRHNREKSRKIEKKKNWEKLRKIEPKVDIIENNWDKLRKIEKTWDKYDCHLTILWLFIIGSCCVLHRVFVCFSIPCLLQHHLALHGDLAWVRSSDFCSHASVHSYDSFSYKRCFKYIRQDCFSYERSFLVEWKQALYIMCHSFLHTCAKTAFHMNNLFELTENRHCIACVILFSNPFSFTHPLLWEHRSHTTLTTPPAGSYKQAHVYSYLTLFHVLFMSW